MDGHWTVKWLDACRSPKLRRSGRSRWRAWCRDTLASFVNCASPGCHGSGWVDAAGKRWEGVPLYLVAGLVDDKKKHGEGATTRGGAEGLRHPDRGADGTVTTIDSRDIAGKDDVVLSSKVDGGELPDQYFPLGSSARA